jgi:hypothetical protein
MDKFRIGNIAKTKLLWKEIMESMLLKILTVKLLQIDEIVYFA